MSVLILRRSAIAVASTAVAVLGASVTAGPPIVEPQPAMGEPLLGLTAQEEGFFLVGREDYTTLLSAPEGLGPIFNKESCGSCHTNPIGGTGTQTVVRFGASGKGGFEPLEHLGGSLLQMQNIGGCEEVVPAQATVTALRVTNGALGYGLIEAIPDSDLLALESTGPGVSGRAHMTEAFEAPGVPRVGRFGWKAQLPTILSFSADASLMEMGLTNRFLMEENDPNGVMPPSIEECDDVPDPEDGPDGDGLHFIDRVTHFQRYLAAPPQTPKSGMSGEVIFTNVGCAQCHTPSFTTSNDPMLEDAIRSKAIRPYSDFLLHDMGQTADFIAQGDAGERELRTPPLWGLVHRDPFWHDGRFGGGTFAERVTDAIEAHGALLSEGQESAANFDNLSSANKNALIAFLASLGRREFDSNLDDEVLLDDFIDFHACMGGPYTADDACAVHDIDQDGDVDLSDYDSFLLAYSGPRRDCNNNNQLDLTEIVNGSGSDADQNGILDGCAVPSCTADITGSSGVTDNTVDTFDLLKLLDSWGGCNLPCPGDCFSDLNDDCVVDVFDLLLLIEAWGSC